MTSFVFRAPGHIEAKEIMKWGPGGLHVHGEPQDVETGDYVYVRHGDRILFRTPFVRSEWRPLRPRTEGGDAGPGWVVVCGKPESPPPGFSYKPDPNHRQGIRYLWTGKLW